MKPHLTTTAHMEYPANYQVRFDYFDWSSANQQWVAAVFGKWRWGNGGHGEMGELKGGLW